jgi:hypothetical protein
LTGLLAFGWLLHPLRVGSSFTKAALARGDLAAQGARTWGPGIAFRALAPLGEGAAAVILTDLAPGIYDMGETAGTMVSTDGAIRRTASTMMCFTQKIQLWAAIGSNAYPFQSAPNGGSRASAAAGRA